MNIIEENDIRDDNSWLIWCIVSIFISYFIGQYFGMAVSVLIVKYELPEFFRTLVIALTPPVFLIGGVLIVSTITGRSRKLIDLCEFQNWRWFYIPETIGLEIIFWGFSIAFGVLLLIFKTFFPVFFKFLEKISNSPYVYIKNTDWNTFAILAFVAVVIAPIVEEIIFRGVMFNGLKKYINIYAAAIITSLIFSAFHFNILQFLPLFLLGLLFQFLYIKHKSIYPGMVFHALHNALAMTFLFLIKFFNWDIPV